MRTVFIATLLVALAALSDPLGATVVVPADIGELARDARVIVRGRVVAVDGRWTEDRRTIETLVTIEAASYLKGALGPTLQFRVPGGDLGRYRSIVVGAPLFAVDEQVVVFLGANGPAVPYIVGFNQGVYRIARSADNSGWLVTPPALLPSAGGTTPVVRGDPSRRPLPLVDFEQRVRALAGGAK
jgi:hypothetical protein